LPGAKALVVINDIPVLCPLPAADEAHGLVPAGRIVP
jgi:hypothetical protein